MLQRITERKNVKECDLPTGRQAQKGIPRSNAAWFIKIISRKDGKDAKKIIQAILNLIKQIGG